MSSSSSTTGLSRPRSLRQPAAGRGKALGTDGDRTEPRMAAKTRDAKSKNASGPPAALAPVTASASASVSADQSGNMSPSRLPKPGGPLTTTRPRAGTAGPVGGATTTRSRPNSGIFGLNRSTTVATRKPATENTAEEAAEPSRPARPTITTNTRLMRPKSISSVPKLSPTTSGRPSPLGPTPSTSSTSTAKPLSPRTTRPRPKSIATSLSSTTTLRPPRPPSAGSIASTSTNTASVAATTTSKRPVGRANTVATRAPQQRPTSTTASADTSVLGGASASASSTNTKIAKQPPCEEPPRLRPAFSTLQQHYSPARNLAPKPLTSTYLAPPTPSKLPANVALSSETARLQTELLQLHLLHRDADAILASWHASAKERLGRRFAELAGADAEVAREEAAVEEARNLAALKVWGGNGGAKALEEKIQALDEVLSGLWSLGEPGGRYARVVKRFEKWVEQMMVAVEARRRAGGLGALMDSGEVAFVGELDHAWRDEVSSLARKLDGWRRQLGQLEDGVPEEELGEDQQASSLTRILAGCRIQVCDMLAELDVIEQIERDAIAQEAAWIKKMSREDEADDTPSAGAIWRAF